MAALGPARAIVDRDEAAALLEAHLDTYRALPYAALVERIGADAEGAGDASVEVAAPSGRRYQIEVQVVWDEAPGGAVRVLAAIDDGRWSSLRPLSRDLLITRPSP